MSGAYPHFKPCYTHEELVEHFLLTPADPQLVLTCRGDANRCGMALLLKALAYLGYFPEKLDRMPRRGSLVHCRTIGSTLGLLRPISVG